MKLHSLLLLAILGLTSLARPLQARSIDWSNSVFDELYNSSGSTLDSSYRFEIGTFINGFTPTGSNVSNWSANWITFDLAFYDTSLPDPAAGGWNVDVQFFSSSANHTTLSQSSSAYTTPGSVFPQSSVAYLWVYNSKDVVFTSEWALVWDEVTGTNTGDSWRFPNPTDQLSTPLTWGLSDAEKAIFGAVQSGASQGAGTYSSQPGSYSLQTYQVPEPGGALLIASAGFLFLLRRSRFTRH